MFSQLQLVIVDLSFIKILHILLSSVIGVSNISCVGLLYWDDFLLWVLGISILVYFPILSGVLMLLWIVCLEMIRNCILWRAL